SSQARLVPRRGRDFAFLAQLGFGGTGEKVMSFVTSLEIWFALVTYIVMNGVNISAFCHGAVSQRLAASLSCCLAALMVFLPMRIYSYLSVVASAALAVAAISLISAALTMDEWAGGSDMQAKANPYDHLGSPALVQLQILGDELRSHHT
ncbi:unnamed protein product, partial [Effrenium voratum]